MKPFVVQSINSIAISLVCCWSFGQTSEKLAVYKKKHPGHNYAKIVNSSTVTIDLEKGLPVVRTNRRDEFIVLNQNGVTALFQDEIQFSSFETVEKLEAYSLIPNGKEGKKVKVTEFMTKKAESEGSVFHDDTQMTSFSYPSLCEGAVRVLDYTEKTTENRFPFGFTFDSSIPIDLSTFVIDCDSNIHLKFELYNDKKKEVKYLEKIEKGRRIMTWSLVNPAILKSEDRAPSSRYYSIHLMGQITDYNSKVGKVSLVGNAKDLHTWYQNHIKNVLSEVPSDQMKSVTDSIVKGKNTELEKVKAIYYWVQGNIKYIAFEEGMNGFVPRQPSSILKKRYGDCKDMASLIYSMLKYANVPAYLTWIGTRDLPYKYSEFPSSICDNHMITTYLDGGKPLFLDATCSFLPLGLPSYGIIGKEAFVNISPTEYRILNVPTMQPKDSYWIDSSFIRFEGKKIIGKNRGVAAGFYNVFINDLYNNCAKSKMNELVQSLNEKGNNSFKVTNAQAKNVGNRDTTLNISYDFEINNYVTSYENEVYVNMILEKDISFGELKSTRFAPLYLDNLSNNNYVVVLDVPSDYTVKSVPKETSYSSEFVDFNVSYKQVASKITMTLKLDLKFLLLQPESFSIWNEYVKIMKSSIVETVVLQKK